MQTPSAYQAAGVDIDAGAAFVAMIKDRIRKVWPSDTDIGGFAGTIQLKKPTYKIAAGADGSGTLAILCALTNQFFVVGNNAAAMSVVDTYVNGARPVGILDMLDVARLIPDVHIGVIEGIIAACKMAEPCILLGGETAELPDMFKHDYMVNVNTATFGVPEHDIITGNVKAGQKVYGWPSEGPASNGFSLIRKVFGLKGDPDEARAKLAEIPTGYKKTLAEMLLVPIPVWVNAIEAQRMMGVRFAAHAHITGGGMVDNIPRVLPPDCKVVIDRSAWQRPPAFRLIQETGKVSSDEMDHVFNQGIMIVSLVEGDKMPRAKEAVEIGTVQPRLPDEKQVQFVGTFND